MNGRFAISTAGHDAGKVYVIVGKDKEILLLADGVERKIANPKKKNKKHVSIIGHENEDELLTMISEKKRGCDEAIRQAIHHFIKDNLKFK